MEPSSPQPNSTTANLPQLTFNQWRLSRHNIDSYRQAGELYISFRPATNTFLVRDGVNLFTELSEADLLYWLRQEAVYPGSLYTQITGIPTLRELHAREMETLAKQRQTPNTFQSPFSNFSLEDIGL